MKLSVIVPVFNTATGNKLQYCLDSLINQTITDYEIIAVNDASTDNSLEVLQAYEAKHPGLVKVVTYPDNRHQGGARNEGLKIAAGDWISFVDSDDWVSSDYFEKLIKKGEETGATVVGSSYTQVSTQTFTPGEIFSANLPEQNGVITVEKLKSLLLDTGSMMMKIYRREMIFDNNLSFPEHMFYEDNAAGPIWAFYYRHFELADGPLYYYYQHPGSTIHTINEQKCSDRMKAADIMLEETKKRGFFDEYSEEITALYIRLYFINTLFSYMIGSKKKKYSYVKTMLNGMLAAFPDFRSNSYYPTLVDAEQRKMVDLMIVNPFGFFVYYKLLWKYRNFRKKLSH